LPPVFGATPFFGLEKKQWKPKMPMTRMSAQPNLHAHSTAAVVSANPD